MKGYNQLVTPMLSQEGNFCITRECLHEMIARGFMYTSSLIIDLPGSGTAGGITNLLFDLTGFVNPQKRICLIPPAYSTSLGYIEVSYYVGGSYTKSVTPADELYIYNRNDTITTASEVSISKNPTVTTPGLMFSQDTVGSAGSNQFPGGGSSPENNQLSLGATIQYIVQFKNTGTDAARLRYSVSWVENFI